MTNFKDFLAEQLQNEEDFDKDRFGDILEIEL